MKDVEPASFRPSKGRRAYWAFLTAMPLGFVVLTLVMPLYDPIRTGGQLAVAIGCFVLFTVLSGGGIYALYISRTCVDVDAEGLTCRLGTRTERVHWQDIASARCSSSDGTTWQVGCRDGRTFKIETYFLDRREDVKGILQAARSTLPIQDVASFRYSLAWFAGPFLILVSGAMFAVAYLAHTDADFARRGGGAPILETVGVLMGVLMIFMALHFMTTRYRIDGNHLYRTGILGNRSILLSLVAEIDLSSTAESDRRSASELMKLRYDGRQMFVTSQLQDYPILRDRILSLTPNAKIVDRRRMKV